MLEQDQVQKAVNNAHLEVPLASFPIPKDRRGRIQWSALGQNPHLRLDVINQEACRFVAEGGLLIHPALIRAGLQSLSQAIVKYYPGSIKGLRQHLGLGDTLVIQDPETSRTTRINYWNPERIKQEAQAVLQEADNINQRILIEQSRSDLRGAINRHYPGKMTQLRRDLGLRTNKGSGEWTVERIKQEALEFQQQHGKLSSPLAEKSGRSDLSVAIRRHYPGGMLQLKKDLQMEISQRPSGYWTAENMLKEGAEFVRIHGNISDKLLGENGMSGFTSSINKYPGGWRQFRADLGLEPAKRPIGYWTKETLEKEALEFWNKEGSLTYEILLKKGAKALASAISSRYPGGWPQIRRNLGIDITVDESISSEDANEQLRRLLEE